MNSFSKYLCMGALGLGLWSCSSDEPVVKEIPKFEGDKATMTINILGPSGLTRADGEDDEYVFGTENENKVGTLSFYFYDNGGGYVTCVENVTYEKGGISNDPLVEQIGKSKIVLTELTGKDYPSYMVAVLNGGSLNLKNKSLERAAEEIREASAWATTDGAYSNFVMTSATHSGNNDSGYFFATPIEEKHFAEMEGSENANDYMPSDAVPVNIYVERLASKVKLVFGENFTLSNSGNYEINLPARSEDPLYNVNGMGQHLRLKLLGWNVNGTAKTVRYFKQVNSATTHPFVTDDGWDFDGTYRCYWALTPGYGTNDYPSSFEDVNKKYSGNVIDNLAGYDAKDNVLNYINWNEVKNSGFASTIKYVLPHTERKSKILADGNLVHGGLTEVLIAGQIVDENDDPLTLYQLGLQFFTQDKVIPHVLNTVADLNIWKKTSETTSSQITPDDLDLEFGFDGTFKLKLKNTSTEWYKDSQCGTDSKWASSKAVIDYINSHLPSKQTFAFINGMLYYNIPIKHIRPFDGDGVKTGNYGVVRNHHYQITVNNVFTLGHAVYRPNEDIIPPSDATRFMIGSSIHILSWRLVSQSVDL